MALALSEDQVAIRDAARDFLDERAGFERLRATVDRPAGWDADLWRGFARELGFSGLGIAEAEGGIGLGPVEQALVLEELGRTLAPIPWFESVVLAGGLVTEGFAGDVRRDLLGRIAGGEIATLALRDEGGGRVPGAIGPRLAGGRLSGAAHYVPFGHVATLLIVAARDETGGIALAALPADRTGVSAERMTSLDPTRPFARIRFDDVALSAAEVATDAGAALSSAWRRAGGLLAAEQVGGAARSLEETVAYARDRVQFGRTIGSFQAVKHRLADMKLLVDSARSAADWAVRAVAEGRADAATACAGARAYCSQAFLACAGDAIQLHGGIGFTWEHHAHLFFKRARGTATLLDPADAARDAVARAIIDEVAA